VPTPSELLRRFARSPPERLEGDRGFIGRSPRRCPTRAEQARRIAHSSCPCPTGIHLWHGPGTHDRRRRCRRSCHRRAGAASQLGTGLTNLGWTGTSAGSDEFGQLDRGGLVLAVTALACGRRKGHVFRVTGERLGRGGGEAAR